MDIAGVIGVVAVFALAIWMFDSHQTDRYRRLDARLSRVERAVRGLAFLHQHPTDHAKLKESEKVARLPVEDIQRELESFLYEG